MGYHQAGFEVVGVDIAPQKHYPFEFIQADALAVLRSLIHGGVEGAGYRLQHFNAIHASPPCQDYSKAVRHLSLPQPRLIEPTRALLSQTGRPYIIENVVGAPIPTQPTLDGVKGVMLCGTSFGLPVYRHRLFETTFLVPTLPCNHKDLAMNPYNRQGQARLDMVVEIGSNREKHWREAMGVGWMLRDEGREAIPPAYTKYIGEALMRELS